MGKWNGGEVANERFGPEHDKRGWTGPPREEKAHDTKRLTDQERYGSNLDKKK